MGIGRRLLQVEICLRDGLQGVVGGRLHLGLAGTHGLANGQRLEEGLGQGEDGVGRSTDDDAGAAGADDGPLDGLNGAVVTVVIGAPDQVGQPEHTGRLLLGQCPLKTPPGQLDVQAAHVAQLQGRRQIDGVELALGHGKSRQAGRRGKGGHLGGVPSRGRRFLLCLGPATPVWSKPESRNDQPGSSPNRARGHLVLPEARCRCPGDSCGPTFVLLPSVFLIGIPQAS
jgi:hypothetical protein